MIFPKSISSLVSEYKEKYLQPKKGYADSLLGEVKRVSDALLDDKFHPSVELKNILNKQMKRAVYPMEVAIVGQFSSGKSTFLNALLSKDILSTGITPVTSKVIYINYGEEHRLRVTYKSGAHAYHPIEKLPLFSDQRVENIEDIKYLTIYAPVEILKELSFVDTPGLNSQSQEDTQSTKKVFQDVGGIIWLTLMDNAGKRSEQEILDRYMSAFKTKSLCLLNHKDKFTEAQILATTAYVEERFAKYFLKVIPISAKKALEARCLEPGVLREEALTKLIKAFKLGVEENPSCRTLKFFEEDFDHFKEEIEGLSLINMETIQESVEASNMNDVLDYIENEMRPNANASKAYRIKNDLQNICDILMNAYHTMCSVYEALVNVLLLSKEKSLEKLDEITVHNSHGLTSIHAEMERLFHYVSSEIYVEVSEEKMTGFNISHSSFLKQEKIEKYNYSSFKIQQNAVMNKLFYNEQQVDTKVRLIQKHLKEFDVHVSLGFEIVYNILHTNVSSWQKKYLLLSKNREISSDLEFSKVKRFASKAHENILSTFHTSLLGHVENLKEKSAYLQGAISYNIGPTVEVSMCQLNEKILESETIYKKDPARFSIYKPSEEDIFNRLKMNFDFEKLDELLLSNYSYLSKIVKKSKVSFKEITEEKIDFIEKEKQVFLKKIEALTEIRNTIYPEQI